MANKNKLNKKVLHFAKCQTQLTELREAEKLLEKEADKTAKEIFGMLKGENAEIPEPEIYELGEEKYLLEFVPQMVWDLIAWRKNIKIRKLK